MVDAESNADAPAPVAIFKKRGAKGKANIRKRAATPPPANSDSDSDFSSSEDESGKRVKRRKKNAGTITATSKDNKSATQELHTTTFTADRNVPITNVNDATKASNWYDDDSKDELSTSNLLGTSRTPTQSAGSQHGTYKGLANQTTFIQKRAEMTNKTVGPMKAPTNVRTVTVIDYSPDSCKDYRLTGFCGFGDNCKFLHSRDALKAGWQLDKEWEDVTKGKKHLAGTTVASAERTTSGVNEGDDDEALLESIPFACIICKESYRAPVVTRCGHYFCEPCALKRYRKDPSCAACGSSTNGVFNSASRLTKLLERKKQREEKKRQEAIEAGEEVSDAEGSG